MSYQYKGKPVAVDGLLTVEQERRRNAEIAMTIRQMSLERQRLEDEAEKVRSVLDALRSSVNSERFETTRMAAYRERMRQLPPPVHGGRDGLLAATRELEAYERRLKPRKPSKGVSHGTWRRYYEWKCRCEACAEFAARQSERNRLRYQARKQQAA